MLNPLSEMLKSRAKSFELKRPPYHRRMRELATRAIDAERDLTLADVRELASYVIGYLNQRGTTGC